MWDASKEIFQRISSLIESQQSAWALIISTGLVAAVSAYWGALGAQRSINRENKLRRKIELIMAANAASSLSVTIFNQAASMKKQYHLPKLEAWQNQRAIIEASAPGEGRVVVQLNYGSPPTVTFPIKSLSDLIYSKLTLNGRPLAALAEIVQAGHTINDMERRHPALITELQALEQSAQISQYFGLQSRDGVDDRFRDMLHNQVELADNLMFFSNILTNDLIGYAEFVRRQASRKERRQLPNANNAPQMMPEHKYLMPNHAHHNKWLERHILSWDKPKMSILDRVWPF